ncbi:TetR/AcrR family transcriptional regulator [Nocardioides sp. Bht2]|uniref:TetR/AcrR family transcriptional regulator n=1 Tax=Nocardioides sp. Bht2 TaxID=3392297 RepID=UPI0039B65781
MRSRSGMAKMANAEPVGRSYAGQSRAERQAARRATLIEAGLDVLAEQGLTGVGVRPICASAGLTARYFYESFPSLDDLLIALCESVGAEIVDAGLRGLREAADDWAAQIEACVAGAFDVILDDPRKACVVAVGAGHAGMNATRQKMLLDYADLVIAQFDLIAPAMAGTLSRPRAVFLVGGAVELVTARITGQLEIDRDALVAETTGVFLAAMGAHG